MRRLPALLLTLCLLLCAAGCGADTPDPTGAPEPSPTAFLEPAPTQTTTAIGFSLAYDPNASLDPIAGDSQVNRALIGLVWQGLYELDNTFRPQPVLAKSSRVSEDGLTWTFSLADETFFSDGTTLTGARAADCLNAARTSPVYSGRLAGITAVTGDENTVTVTLSAPNGNLPALLDVPVTLAAEGGPAPLGTGYYRVETDGEGGLRLGINPYHFAATLPYQQIPLIPVTTADERASAFNSGRVALTVADLTGAYALGYNGGCEIIDCPTTDLIYVGFRASGGVCASARVRLAFAKAFDRNGAAGSLLEGHALASALPVSSCAQEYDGNASAALAYDPDPAAALLDEAGYSLNEEDGLRYDGEAPLAVTLLVNSDGEGKQAVAELAASGLEQLGVTVTVTSLPWADYLSALSSGRFDLYVGETILPGDFDPSALLTGDLNYGGFEGGELSGLLSAWKSARGDGRLAAAAALWGRFVQDVPFAPICFKNSSLLIQWGVASNLQPTRANPFYHMEDWTVY